MLHLPFTSAAEIVIALFTLKIAPLKTFPSRLQMCGSTLFIRSENRHYIDRGSMYTRSIAACELVHQ